MVLGATGMLGNAMIRKLSANSNLTVFGTARVDNLQGKFSDTLSDQIIFGVDVDNHDSLIKAFIKVQPDIVINCVGLVKQIADANDVLHAVPINTLLPHRLAALCDATCSRLIHISTDCVFSGTKGNYLESDFPDAHDLYGRSKLLGEVNYPNAITLRTSIIGHELSGKRSLICWFLAQQEPIKGFTEAVFSGMPTVELARVISEFVIPNSDLNGLYHVAAKPINKFDLLNLVATIYGKNITINPSKELVINRSLNADKFKAATGYVAPEWPELVQKMHAFN